MREAVQREKDREQGASDGDDRGHVKPCGHGQLLHPRITMLRSSGIGLASIVQNVGPLGVVPYRCP